MDDHERRAREIAGNLFASASGSADQESDVQTIASALRATERAALERAAGAVEAHARERYHPVSVRGVTASECADAIRALMEDSDGG